MDNKKAIEVLDTVSLYDLTEPPYNEGLWLDYIEARDRAIESTRAVEQIRELVFTAEGLDSSILLKIRDIINGEVKE